MKTVLIFAGILWAMGNQVQAQSTTGGRSGGSTASTGSGYETTGKRPAETSAASMTIADEGASRAYMYVPPTPQKNRSASPDGSDGKGSLAAPASRPAPTTTPTRKPTDRKSHS